MVIKLVNIFDETRKNIDEAQQYAAEGFDVEVECLKKNDFGYLVPWRSKYICSVCGIDSDWTHFMDFHKFFGGLTLNEQKTDRMNETDYELFEEWFSSLKEIDSLKKYYFKGRVSGVAKYLIEKYAFVKKWSHQKIESAISTFFETKKAFNEIVRKVGNEYVLYSKKKDPKTGKRRVLGREKSKEAIEKRERSVLYWKHRNEV